MSNWTSTVARCYPLTPAGHASVFSGIASLDAENPNNGWMTLSKYSADPEPLGFAQTVAVPNGFIIKIPIETPQSSDLGFWKAGPRGFDFDRYLLSAAGF